MDRLVKISCVRWRHFLAALTVALPVLALSAPAAQALTLGAGQTATIDFDFGAFGGSQPATFTFEIETATPFDLSDSAGTFLYSYQGVAAAPVSNSFGYDGTGGYNPGPVSHAINAIDLSGSLNLGVLTESWTLTAVYLTIVDNLGEILVSQVSLDLPEAPDTQVPEPGPLAVLVLGLAGLGVLRRHRPIA